MLLSIYHNKSKLDKHKEDSKTSSIIGTMKNLPADLFWHTLSTSCSDNSTLDKISGELLNIFFWTKWFVDKTRYGFAWVEPDVFMQFERFDLIIEVKKEDGDSYNKQDARQWEREATGYYANVYKEENCDRPLYMIIIGGFTNMNKEHVNIKFDIVKEENREQSDAKIETKCLSVFKCNWFTLLTRITALKKAMEENNYPSTHKNALMRILEDVIIGFNMHGVYYMKWLDSITKDSLNINNTSFTILEDWETNYTHEE